AGAARPGRNGCLRRGSARGAADSRRDRTALDPDRPGRWPPRRSAGRPDRRRAGHRQRQRRVTGRGPRHRRTGPPTLIGCARPGRAFMLRLHHLAVLLLIAAPAAAQDTPLSQILLEGESWHVVAKGYDSFRRLYADKDGNVYVDYVRKGMSGV